MILIHQSTIQRERETERERESKEREIEGQTHKGAWENILAYTVI